MLLVALKAHPLCGNPLQLGREEKVIEEKQPIPRPSKLTASWWKYFEGEEEELPEKITAFEKVLQELVANYADGDLPVAAQSHVNKIILNIRLLPELKKQIGSKPIPPPALKETYSLEEVLNFLQDQEKTKIETASLDNEISSLKNRISKAQSQVDTLLASYLETKETDPNRFLLGLEIISRQVIIKVEEENLRVKRELAGALEEKQNSLIEQLKHAKNNILANRNLLDELEKKKKEKESFLEEIQSKRLGNEAELLGTFPETPSGQEELKNLTQTALLTKLEEEKTKTEILSLNIQEYITFLLIPSPEKEGRPLFFDLQKEKNRLKERNNSFLLYSEELQASILETEEKLKTFTDEKTSEEEVLTKMISQRREINNQALIEKNLLEQKILETRFLINLLEAQIFDSYTTFNSLYFKFKTVLISLWEFTSQIAQQSLFKIGDVPLTLFGIFRAIFIFIMALVFSSFVQKFISGIASRQRNIAEATFYTLGRLAHYTIVMLGFFISLSSIGLNFRNLAIIAGALSVGIGFGLQSIVNNFLSGLIILFEQNIKVGDYLELETGYRGVVKEITVRTTLIRTNDGIEVIIPNSEIIGNKVINWTMKDAFVRFKIGFGVAYGSDKELVKKIALQVAENSPFTLKNHPDFPEPQVRLTSLADSALEFELVVWVNAVAARRRGYTTALYLWDIHENLIKNGIEIPFPQRVVHFAGEDNTSPENKPTETPL